VLREKELQATVTAAIAVSSDVLRSVFMSEESNRARWAMRRLWLTKAVRAPQTIFHLLVDRAFAPLWVRWLGVEMGNGCYFVGHPLIKIAPGARVTLGNEVHVYSRANSNPAGLPHPTILAALEPQSFITIADKTGVSGASIAARSGITIGKNVLVGAGACIWDTDFHPIDPKKRGLHPTRDAQSAPIRIDDEVFIGARAMILKGVTIGLGAVVGACAVVTKNVAPYAIVAGNPARVVGTVSSLRQEEMRGVR
jgi:acetyltransferase-like isoleucine patch superfamily enzyme